MRNVGREVVGLAPIRFPTIRLPTVGLAGLRFPSVCLPAVGFGIGPSSTGSFVFRSGLALGSHRFGAGSVRLRRRLHFGLELLEDDILFADAFRLLFLFLLFGRHVGVGAVQALVGLFSRLPLRHDQLRRRFRRRLHLTIDITHHYTSSFNTTSKR